MAVSTRALRHSHPSSDPTTSLSKWRTYFDSAPSYTLSARSLLALLEECNPDAGNDRADYASIPTGGRSSRAPLPPVTARSIPSTEASPTSAAKHFASAGGHPSSPSGCSGRNPTLSLRIAAGWPWPEVRSRPSASSDTASAWAAATVARSTTDVTTHGSPRPTLVTPACCSDGEGGFAAASTAGEAGRGVASSSSPAHSPGSSDSPPSSSRQPARNRPERFGVGEGEAVAYRRKGPGCRLAAPRARACGRPPRRPPRRSSTPGPRHGSAPSPPARTLAPRVPTAGLASAVMGRSQAAAAGSGASRARAPRLGVWCRARAWPLRGRPRSAAHPRRPTDCCRRHRGGSGRAC